jgi:ABC-type tungstate transport system permease subunit
MYVAAAACLFLFVSAASWAGVTVPRAAVRIAECANSPASQLLLLRLAGLFDELDIGPVTWQTLKGDSADDIEESSKADVAGVFDIVFTGNPDLVSKLEQKGLLRASYPVFREELILAGPAASARQFSGLQGVEAMRKIFSEERVFFSLFKNKWSADSEAELWRKSRVEAPGTNRKYVESSKGDVEALVQAGDEGGFILLGEASFAQYLDSQGGDPMLVKISGTGIFKETRMCLISDAGFRKERTASADKYAERLLSPEGGDVVESFEMGGMNPFKRGSLGDK